MHPIRRPPRRGFGEQPATLAAIQNLFARGEQGGYWPADPAYLYEDSAGTIPASVNGVVGLRFDVSRGLQNIENTTNSNNEAALFSLGTGIAPLNISRSQQSSIPGSGYYAEYVSTSNSHTYHQHSLFDAIANKTYKFSLKFYVPTGGISTISIYDNSDGSWFAFRSSVKDQWVNVSVIRPPKATNWSYTIGNNSTDTISNGQIAFLLDDVSVIEIVGNHAIQATTANKPYLRRTPTTGKYWYDSNTDTGAMNVTFASAIGRRNLLTYTEDFSNAEYTALLSSVVANQSVSPDGTLSADYLKEDNTTGLHQCFYSITVTANSTYVFSVFAKHGGRQIRFANDTGGKVSIFDLSNGTVVSGDTASIVDAGGGWYRCCHSFTPTTTSGVTYITLFSGGAYYYAGDNTSGSYLWGAQLEVGTTPTDYQKIVAGPSAVLDPAALAATYPHNISATTNCTIACVTPEGVVIADNQTVGTTFNIAPPYGYNSDVLIINRALTPAEKALVTRVMQRSVPTLGSELVVNGTFDTDRTGWAGWNLVYSPNNIIQSNGKGVFLMDGLGEAVSANLDIAVSANNAYFLTCFLTSNSLNPSDLAISDGLNYAYRFGFFASALNLQFRSIVPTQNYIRLYAYTSNNTAIQDALYDNISLKAIL